MVNCASKFVLMRALGANEVIDKSYPLIELQQAIKRFGER